MFEKFYRIIMDENVNAFRSLPKTVRFQLMTVLAFMWSSIFTIWIGTSWILGPTVAAHLLLAIGVIFTADTFARAQEGTLRYGETFRDRRDGRARHEDVWAG